MMYKRVIKEIYKDSVSRNASVIISFNHLTIVIDSSIL